MHTLFFSNAFRNDIVTHRGYLGIELSKLYCLEQTSQKTLWKKERWLLNTKYPNNLNIHQFTGFHVTLYTFYTTLENIKFIIYLKTERFVSCLV